MNIYSVNLTLCHHLFFKKVQFLTWTNIFVIGGKKVKFTHKTIFLVFIMKRVTFSIFISRIWIERQTETCFNLSGNDQGMPNKEARWWVYAELIKLQILWELSNETPQSLLDEILQQPLNEHFKSLLKNPMASWNFTAATHFCPQVQLPKQSPILSH